VYYIFMATTNTAAALLAHPSLLALPFLLECFRRRQEARARLQAARAAQGSRRIFADDVDLDACRDALTWDQLMHSLDYDLHCEAHGR
jgi:hypothetical protein